MSYYDGNPIHYCPNCHRGEHEVWFKPENVIKEDGLCEECEEMEAED